MNKAIVTGATGFLGTHLVHFLEARGYTVIALGRDVAKGKKLNSEKTRFKAVDITDRAALEAAFEPADIVFHSAALSTAWGDSEDFERANIQGSRNVLACCEALKIKRLVHVSSTSVYFDFSHKTDIKETDSLAKTFANDYARTKYLAEKILLDNRRHTEVVIIRPRGIVGDGDTSIMPRIVRLAGKGFFPLIDNGTALVDVTYVKNVAYALYLAGEAPDIDGRIFNISNLEPMTVRELLQKVLQKRDMRCRLIPVRFGVMYGIARALELIYKSFRLGEPPVTCYSVGLLAKTQTLDVQAAVRELGYSPLYSLDHAIDQYLEWERQHA